MGGTSAGDKSELVVVTIVSEGGLIRRNTDEN